MEGFLEVGAQGEGMYASSDKRITRKQKEENPFPLHRIKKLKLKT